MCCIKYNIFWIDKSKQVVLFIIHLQLRKKLSSTHQGKVKIIVLNSG